MSPVEVGILLGTLWSASLITWTMADLIGDEPNPILLMIKDIYYGFDISWRGVIIGGLWAFGDGFVTGYLLSSLWYWITS